MLAHQKYTWTRTAAHQERTEMPRHRLMVVRYKDTILFRSEREDIWIRNSLQLCFVSREEIYCGLISVCSP